MSLKRFCDNCEKEIATSHFYDVMITINENKPGENANGETNAYGEYCRNCAVKESTLKGLMEILEPYPKTEKDDSRHE